MGKDGSAVAEAIVLSHYLAVHSHARD